MRTLGHCGLAVLLSLGAAAAQTPDELLAQFRYPESAAAADAAVKRLEQAGRADTLEYACALDMLAKAREKAGTPFAETSKLLNRAIELKTRLAGANDLSVAQSLNILGGQSYTARDYRGAAAALERAQSIEQAHPGASVIDLTDTLIALGRVLSIQQQTPKALQLHQQALALLEKEFGPTHRRTAGVLYVIGNDYRESGDLTKAEDYYTRAMRIFRDHPIDRDLELAMSNGSLANVYRERGELARAQGLYEDAIREQVRILGGNNPQLIPLYNNYGLNLKELGEFKASRDTFDRALELSRANLGEENPVTAQLLGNLGIVLVESGELLAARDCYERALAIQEKRLGPNHDLVASVLFSLGNVQRQLKDYSEARRLNARAFAIYEKAFGPDNPKTLQVLGSLATADLELKDYAAARSESERAHSSLRRMLGEDNVRTNAALKKLADVRAAMGDRTGARELYRQTVTFAEREFGKDNPKTAELVLDLAASEQDCGAHTAALELFDRAIAIWTPTFGPDYYLLAQSFAGKGKALFALGRPAEALAAALESARVRRENVMLGARGIAERQALLYAGQDRGGLDLALRIAAEGKAPSRELPAVWDALIRDRALVLDEMIQRRNLAARTAGGEIGELWKQVSDARERLASAAVRDTGGNKMVALRNAVDTAERNLALKSETFRTQQRTQLTGFEDVRAALPAGAALVGYARSGDGYAALVLRAGGGLPIAVNLGSAATIEKLVTAWRAEMDRERESLGRAAARNEKAYRDAGTALRRAIWDPVAPHVKDAKTVDLAADAALLMVNFGTLPVGESQYLIETGPLLQMISTERDLAAPRAARSAGGLLAIGNPDFGPLAAASPVRGVALGCVNFASIRFEALPASGDEARAVAALWRGGGVELEGARATESAFRQQAPGKRVIHIATHGFFLEERCQTAPVLRENPLLRAGLALAGANRRTADGRQQDGILTAEEVATLDLTGTELVVLSGCDTGVGVAQTGEGVLGLRRAFRIAGARTLVTSLWPVDDEDTRQWMLAMYGARSGGVSTAQAAREASLKQLRARRGAGQSTHPVYWGGFIAVGI